MTTIKDGENFVQRFYMIDVAATDPKNCLASGTMTTLNGNSKEGKVDNIACYVSDDTFSTCQGASGTTIFDLNGVGTIDGVFEFDRIFKRD